MTVSLILDFGFLGGFTVTSHAVSRGHLAPLVGRRFVVVGLRVYFAGIQSLYKIINSFILLTHNLDHDFVLYWCGYIGYCVASSFYFVTIKKGKMKKNQVECVQL